MVIELSGQQQLITVRLSGEIDHFSVTAIKNAVEDSLMSTGAINVAFDFSDVTFMDSSGIGLILGRFKTVSALGGKIILFGMNRETNTLMKMSGIDKIAQIY